MDQVENERATAAELVSFARANGVDLAPLLSDSMFSADGRWLSIWRKRGDLPCSGAINEPEGALKYNLQGHINSLPQRLNNSNSGSAFQGGWSEAGTLGDLASAFELLVAWLLDQHDVDDLPNRFVKRDSLLRRP